MSIFINTPIFFLFSFLTRFALENTRCKNRLHYVCIHIFILFPTCGWLSWVHVRSLFVGKFIQHHFNAHHHPLPWFCSSFGKSHAIFRCSSVQNIIIFTFICMMHVWLSNTQYILLWNLRECARAIYWKLTLFNFEYIFIVIKYTYTFRNVCARVMPFIWILFKRVSESTICIALRIYLRETQTHSYTMCETLLSNI